ncbi:MAG TPA: DUF1893 domain-containing protein [Clostridiales bacterium]|nr:DUF1893 domain-containing protein [Clostridiales bacterium]
MKDIEKAVELLKEENLALAIVKDGRIVFRSTDKGISPLYKALKEHEAELEGSSVADRVTGKAAAMICLHAGIKALKTDLISDNAINVLKESNIEYEYNERTPFIKNRDHTGMCPVETISLKTDNINELLNGISDFLEKIKRG